MGGPRILLVSDADELCRTGADLVAGALAADPAASVVAATGRTPVDLYAELAARQHAGLLDASRLTAFQLDEYLGLEPGDRRSLFGWMERTFLQPLQIDGDRVVRLPLEGDAGSTLEDACAAYDRALTARGGLDLAILGLGPNGHLGFNEPPSDPHDPTRGVALSPATIASNAGYWGEVADVPASAVTMGLAQLLASRAIVVLVSGEGKREIVHRALEGPVGPEVPASFLRETDADVTVVVDRAAWGDA
jgi:glucosamine-6-phosphate deaminase